jgi:hypothetical protein
MERDDELKRLIKQIIDDLLPAFNMAMKSR